MSVERCQAETTSSRFVMWKVYLRERVNAFHREDYYSAKICFMLSRVFGGNKRSKVEDFLIKFITEDEEKKKELPKKEQIRKSKRFWYALTGFTKRKK